MSMEDLPPGECNIFLEETGVAGGVGLPNMSVS